MATQVLRLHKEAVENLSLEEYILILNAVLTSQRRCSALLTTGCIKFLAMAGFSVNLSCPKDLGANERCFILPSVQTLLWESQDSLPWHVYSYDYNSK